MEEYNMASGKKEWKSVQREWQKQGRIDRGEKDNQNIIKEAELTKTWNTQPDLLKQFWSFV